MAEVRRRGESAPPEVIARFQNYAVNEPTSTRPARIALGLTLLREVHSPVFLRWVNLLRSHWWPGPVYHARDMYVTQARNLILRDFLRERDYSDALLYWDVDQQPPLAVPGPLSWQASTGEVWQGGWFTDYLQWVVGNEPHKKVLGGLYFSKQHDWELTEDGRIVAGPHEPVAYYSPRDSGGYRPLTTDELIPMLQRPAIYKVDAVGTGSMLIRKDVIERMAELKGGDIFEAPPVRNLNDQIPGSQWTEDTFFCEEVTKRLGEWIWLDTAMRSGHFADQLVTDQDYLQKRGYVTQPHEQATRAMIEQARIDAAEAKRERKAQSRIVLPRS